MCCSGLETTHLCFMSRATLAILCLVFGGVFIVSLMSSMYLVLNTQWVGLRSHCYHLVSSLCAVEYIRVEDWYRFFVLFRCCDSHFNVFHFHLHTHPSEGSSCCLLNFFSNRQEGRGYVLPSQQLGFVRRLAPRPRPVGLLLLSQPISVWLVGRLSFRMADLSSPSLWSYIAVQSCARGSNLDVGFCDVGGCNSSGIV